MALPLFKDSAALIPASKWSHEPITSPKAKGGLAARERPHIDGATHVVGIFQILICLILLVSTFRILSGSGALTFTGFLSQLSNAPSIPFDWLHVFDFSFASTAPSWLQWLASILDTFIDLFKAGMFVGTAVLNCLSFLLYFLRWIFLA